MKRVQEIFEERLGDIDNKESKAGGSEDCEDVATSEKVLSEEEVFGV